MQYSDPDTLTATITPATIGAAITGTVNFTQDGNVLGSSPVINGTAALVTSALPLGTDSIIASYGGDTSEVLVATKGGHLRPGDGSWTLNGSPEYLKQACEASLKRLGVEVIGLYQFHRPDPKVPYADSVGAIRDLLDAGKIRFAGISNADPAQIRQANEILGGRLVSVQNQFSPAFRSSEPELELCAQLDIAFLPWSPLGGITRAGALGDRFAAFSEVGAAHGVSAHQACLAWMLAKAPVVIPIPGSSRPETIRDSAKAVEVKLSAEEFARLD